MWPRYALTEFIRSALAEDVGAGDVTTNAVLGGNESGAAEATAKEDLVLAGIEVFGEVFLTLDPTLIFTPRKKDGEKVLRGEIIAEISGSLASILTAERVALNLLQRSCGIATMTRRFVDEAAGTKARIIDTRKTVPGLRVLDKYAVRAGGGFNHRFALYDGVLIKDNHIAAAGGITAAVKRARALIPHTLKIEVEVKDSGELEEALQAGADSLLLDNMDLQGIAAAVGIVQGRVPLEASGNMTLERIRKVAETGVDFISVGALTHSVQAADISLNITATHLPDDKSEKGGVCGRSDLDIVSLRGRLSGFKTGFPLHYFENVDSTNTVGMKLAGEGAAEGTMVLADRQTAGRGRRQRVWQSPPGCNLYFSIILRPVIPMAKAAQITFLAGVAVADTLASVCPEGVEIKWPNDVLINNRKVCGILSELRTEQGRIEAVLGIGINVNMKKGDFAPEHRQIATSLLEETGRWHSREDVLCVFCTHFQHWYELFLEEGFEPLRKAWLSRTGMVGKNVRILFGNEIKEGIVSGLDDDGALLLAASDGALERIIAGDATIMRG